jgi:hypothetical protein
LLTFLSPLFLVGATAAAVPIVLHLLKREPEPRVKFAAVKLLKHAPVEDTERHRLRELLLLALRVAALVLLAVAFARPFIASGQAVTRGGVTIVALDTSHSMAAPGRFGRARQLAKGAVARVPSGDRVGVVLFSDDAAIAVKPSGDRVLAASAIDQAAPGFGATRYRAALSAAAQALSEAGSPVKGKIVIVTDLQENGWDDGDRVALPEGTRVEIADVGPMPANLAVTAVRASDDRDRQIIGASVHNTGPRARDVRARLTIDGRPAGEAAATIGPNQSADLTFPAARRGTSAAVSVEDPEGLPADNTRYAVLSGPNGPGVLVVGGSGDLTRDAFYVQQALGAGGPGDRYYDVKALSGAQLSAEQPGQSASVDDRLSSLAAVLLVSTRGLERRGRDALGRYVRAGGGLLIAAGPEVDGTVTADILGADSAIKIVNVDSRQEARTLAPADLRHPIFRPFAGASATLGLVRFRTAARIDGAGCQTLARFTTGENALLECAAGDGRALVLASDLDNRWNDFPLHASFVPFLHEAVRYSSGARTRASEYLVGEAPPGVPRQPGIHTLREMSGARRVAVNVDPKESDPGRLTVDEFLGAVTLLKDTQGSAARVASPEERGKRAEQEDAQHLWQLGLALMIMTLVLEGVIASRTA